MNKISKLIRLIVPSLGVLVWVIVFIAVIFKGSQIINADGDLGRHITLGNYILDNREIPVRDIFSHTLPGEPLTPHEWLSEVLFALANRVMGLNGVILLTASVIATAFWLVFKRSQRDRSSFFVLLITAALILLSSAIHWLSRPHIFTFLLLSLWLIVLEDMIHKKANLWWLLPVIMLAWVNLHGAFIAGFVTWFLYGMGLLWDRVWFKQESPVSLPNGFWRSYILGGAGAFLVTLINPVQLKVWSTSFGYVANQFLVDVTEEYWSPDFHSADTWPFLFFLLLLIIVVFLRKSKARAEWVFPAVAWLAMSLYSVRNIPLFVIISAPLLTESLEELFLEVSTRSKFRTWLARRDHNLSILNQQASGFILALLIICMVVFALMFNINLDSQQTGNSYDPQKFPVDAVNWLEENPQAGEVFNYFPWGGYLLYREWPDVKVFIDGQTDFYGEALTRDYLAVAYLNPGWQDILAKYKVDWVIYPEGESLASALLLDEDWNLLYSDSTSVILRRGNSGQ